MSDGAGSGAVQTVAPPKRGRYPQTALALIGAIVAEFVGAEKGLGMLIQSMNFNMDVAGQFSILLILSMLGLCLNGIVAYARRRLVFWEVRTTGENSSSQKGG